MKHTTMTFKAYDVKLTFAIQILWCERMIFRVTRTFSNRVYGFLDGLANRLDKIRSDVLQLKPFPTVEQAYAYVRREDSR